MTATNYAGNGSALSGKQSTINSTAGQLIIGNGNGSTTTSSSLTFSGTTLTATNISGNGSGITGLTATQIPTLATSKISGLDTALSGKQSTINSTAGQLIIGNGNGSTTTSSSLTFSGTTLTATNINATSISIGGSSLLTNQAFVEIGIYDFTYVDESNNVQPVHIWASSTHHKHVKVFINKQLISIGTIGKNGGFTNHWSYSDGYNYLYLEVGSNYAKWWLYRYTGRFIFEILHYV